MPTRSVVLDTETTGLEVREGHRLVEVAGIELVNRRPTGRTFHVYVNPQRAIDPAATDIHGITNEAVANAPLFKDIADRLADFLRGSEILAHNAPFDVAFLDHEFELCGANERVGDLATVVDTLTLARRRHPGQSNSLDALCRRYSVDASGRQYHGALIDADLLARVYLAMTGGQNALLLEREAEPHPIVSTDNVDVIELAKLVPIVRATPQELLAHENRLAQIAKKSGRKPVWITHGEQLVAPTG